MGAKTSAAAAVKKPAAKPSAKAMMDDHLEPAAANGSPRLMTEAEILKAPEKDYMNAAELAFFRNRLQDMEQEILKNAGETTEHLRETIIVPDPADRATIEEEHALELRTRDRERKLLKKIQQSIARIDSGDYGYCEETGDPIGIPRLLARPTATLSLEAQERREMKQKMYGE
jgi:DnaK suppressor protein